MQVQRKQAKARDDKHSFFQKINFFPKEFSLYFDCSKQAIKKALKPKSQTLCRLQEKSKFKFTFLCFFFLKVGKKFPQEDFPCSLQTSDTFSKKEQCQNSCSVASDRKKNNFKLISLDIFESREILRKTFFILYMHQASIQFKKKLSKICKLNEKSKEFWSTSSWFQEKILQVFPNKAFSPQKPFVIFWMFQGFSQKNSSNQNCQQPRDCNNSFN